MKVVLKYEKIQEGHFLKAREYVLEINGQRHNEFLSHDVRVQCLKKALRKFNDDIETTAERFKNHKYGAYLWLFTSDLLRSEELEGQYRIEYLMAIVEYLKVNHKIGLITITTTVNPYIKSFLNRLGVKIAYQYTSCFSSGLIKSLHGLKLLYNTVRFNLKCWIMKPNSVFNGVLIDSSPNIRNNRYDRIERLSNLYENVKYFSAAQSFIKGVPDDRTVVFKKELNLRLVAGVLIKTLKVIFFIKRSKSKIPAAIFSYHNNFFRLLMYADLFTTEKCIEKYFAKSKIKTIIQVSTLNIPVHRLLITLAKKNDIRFIVVASRTFGPYENSEILLDCDVNGYNDTYLPDHYIFKDNYSVEKVFEQYPHLKEQASVGGRFVITKNQFRQVEKPVEPALLLLFNHRGDISHRLLKVIIEAGISKFVKTIIYRCHHIFQFDEEFIAAAFPDNNLINITGKDYAILDEYRVLVITGPTTAAMEVIQFGTVVIWVPFVWDESIIIDDAMRNVGVLTQNVNELTSQTQMFISDTRRFHQQYAKDQLYCNRFFNTNASISEQIKNIEKLN